MTESGKLPRIVCCRCGVSIQPNEANACVACLSEEVDIACHIEKQNTVVFCPKCERYLNPPSQWIPAALESPELLSLCLKRVKGLNKGLKFRSAKFIWTEPHSKRIKIEVTVHSELPTGDLVEQEIPLEFIVHSQQCPDCTRTAAKDYWNACVQVRQRVEHKKTLMNLEQIILRSKAHNECTNIKQVSGGVDFYFNTRSHAVSFVNFLCKHAPCRYQTSQHLKSHDVHNNTYNYKFTFSVEVAPICKNDVVCLSKAQSQRLGGLGPICVVFKVAEAIHLIDPVTCQVGHVDGLTYFSSPFTAIAGQNRFNSFMVVDIEEDRGHGAKSKPRPVPAPVGARLSKRHRPVSVWVMRLNKDSEVQSVDESEDAMVHTRSHLGNIIHVGDKVCGLDFRNCNVNNTEFEKLAERQIPDVLLVLRPARQPGDGDTRSSERRLSSTKAKRKRMLSSTSTDVPMSTTEESEMSTLDDSGDEEEDEDQEDYDENQGSMELIESLDELGARNNSEINPNGNVQ
ncbi:unnamed protein product [Calicophoron daubneyi]|uniref:60S ribosomal export protein NMD3 n=1 Tax=Calicophoron daubneyi TaxID=300641 RepID=A0AAV2T1N7_CALDB